MPFDQHLSMKVWLLIVAAFALVSWGVFRLLNEPFDISDLGPVDMNDERRRMMVDAEAERWK